MAHKHMIICVKSAKSRNFQNGAFIVRTFFYLDGVQASRIVLKSFSSSPMYFRKPFSEVLLNCVKYRVLVNAISGNTAV